MTEWRPGALVRARERDWIVLPYDEPGVVRLRPGDGTAVGPLSAPDSGGGIGVGKRPDNGPDRSGETPRQRAGSEW